MAWVEYRKPGAEYRKPGWNIENKGGISSLETYRRPVGDLDMLGQKPTCLIGDLYMLHQRPIGDRHAWSETDMLGRKPTCLIGH